MAPVTYTLLAAAAAAVLAVSPAAAAGGSMRSMVYRAAVARSGATSDCAAFSSLFAPNGEYEAPMGSGAVVGPTEIAKACEEWNGLLGPAGNGWYPSDLYSSPNRTTFGMNVRAVSAGGCAVDLRGIVAMSYDVGTDAILSWHHYYDGDFVAPSLHGTCTPAGARQ